MRQKTYLSAYRGAKRKILTMLYLCGIFLTPPTHAAWNDTFPSFGIWDLPGWDTNAITLEYRTVTLRPIGPTIPCVAKTTFRPASCLWVVMERGPQGTIVGPASVNGRGTGLSYEEPWTVRTAIGDVYQPTTTLGIESYGGSWTGRGGSVDYFALTQGGVPSNANGMCSLSEYPCIYVPSTAQDQYYISTSGPTGLYEINGKTYYALGQGEPLYITESLISTRFPMSNFSNSSGVNPIPPVIAPPEPTPTSFCEIAMSDIDLGMLNPDQNAERETEMNIICTASSRVTVVISGGNGTASNAFDLGGGVATVYFPDSGGSSYSFDVPAGVNNETRVLTSYTGSNQPGQHNASGVVTLQYE